MLKLPPSYEVLGWCLHLLWKPSRSGCSEFKNMASEVWPIWSIAGKSWICRLVNVIELTLSDLLLLCHGFHLVSISPSSRNAELQLAYWIKLISLTAVNLLQAIKRSKRLLLVGIGEVSGGNILALSFWQLPGKSWAPSVASSLAQCGPHRNWYAHQVARGSQQGHMSMSSASFIEIGFGRRRLAKYSD